MFARMLAKIAHSFAVAEAGQENFEPLLPKIILGTDVSYTGCVIGQSAFFPNVSTRSFHSAMKSVYTSYQL